MRNYADFKDLNKQMKLKFSWLQENYPLSFYYLETEIRLLLSDDEIAQKRNLKEYCNMSSFRVFFVTCYRVFISIFYNIFSQKTPAIYITVPRLTELQKKLAIVFKEKHLRVYQNSSRYYNLLKINEYLPLGALCSNSFGLKNIHWRMYRSGLIKFISSDRNLKKLEKSLNEQVDVVASLLTKLNIKNLILQNEHCPHEKILVMAAEKNKIDFFVVAHGYIQKSSGLVTIAPIRAKELIVWTELQRELLLKETNYCPERIRFYGWPYKISEKVKYIEQKEPLFILSDIDNDFNETEFILTVTVITKLLEKFPNLMIRPHPSFSKSTSSRKKLIKGKFSDNLKKQSLESQLGKALFVTGHDSSVLLQSYFENIPTYRIKELSILDIPEISKLKLSEITKLSNLKIYQKKPDNLIDDVIEKISKRILQ